MLIRDWETRFAEWASPPAPTEQEKCERAVRAVKTAIDASPALSIRNVRVFVQGSYRNRTNVRAESDVDVCVCCSDSMFCDVPPGATRTQFGIDSSPIRYPFDQFRREVGAALVAKFGTTSVRAGRKAFDIHENTYRISADAVPSFDYFSYRFGAPPVVGTAFVSEGKRIINYPEQHYTNGVSKNDETAKRFKAVARIIKRLRYEMLTAGSYPSAAKVQSYELESLVWNVPSPLFRISSDLRADVQSALIHAWNGLETDETCAAWTEVNGIKPLFNPEQSWTRGDARTFLLDAWGYAELDQ
jgi:hypothetical protein